MPLKVTVYLQIDNFLQIGFLGQSNGRRVIAKFWEKKMKNLNIGEEMEVLRYGRK